jgi:urea carboxylase-associated protein 2
MGRIFCSVVEDTAGWHDTATGNSTKALVAKRWGGASYQASRNDWRQNGHDSFLVEAAKYGLDRRDLAANVNWFTKVAIADDGSMMFDNGVARPGAAVTLRFEMDTLVLLHTCPHPLDPSPAYPRKSVTFEIGTAAPIGTDDACRNSAPENGRGFENNSLFHVGCCP